MADIELFFRGSHNLSELHDEILLAMPTLRPYEAGLDDHGETTLTPVMVVIGYAVEVML